jgi:hypothetical protein
MTAHHSNAELQKAAFSTIAACFSNAGGATVEASGCFKAVAAAMTAHPLNAELQADACSALAAMCTASGGAEKIVSAGCVEAVAAAMTAHPRNAELQKSALAFLVAVLGSPGPGHCLNPLFGHQFTTQAYHDVVKQLRTAPVKAAGLAYPAPHAVGTLATLLLSIESLQSLSGYASENLWT